MLKSLFSGVSGLQSHQVAMDIESNNIANVNTTGFKYSRANFSDLLAQTKSIATAPQGQLGGKNPVQVGLGSTVASATRIFSQGSIQNSDKNTDVAIQGDGFFIISPDGGNTYKYTRSGDFKFDAGGNFVDNNGYIAQGWIRDDDTGLVDSTAPITSINIAPGLTTPASPTAEVVLKANLNSGPLVESFSPGYSIESTPPPSSITGISPAPGAEDANGNAIASGDIGVMFNEVGEAFSLQQGQGIWASFLNSTATSTNSIPGIAVGGADTTENVVFELDDGSNKTISFTLLAGNTAAQNAAREAAAINAQSSVTGITATVNANAGLDLVNDNGNAFASHNIRIVSATANAGFDGTEDSVTAYKYTYNSAGATIDPDIDKEFKSLADLREAMELQARAVGNHDNELRSTALANDTGLDYATHDFDIDGTSVTVPLIPTGTTAEGVAAAYALAITNAAIAGITATSSGSTLIISNSTVAAIDLDTTAASTFSAGLSGLPDDTTTEIPLDDGTANENNIAISVNEQGQFEITNPGGSEDGDYDMNLKITGYSADGISENVKFTRNMEALNAVLPSGTSGKALSQSFNAATHSSSIDIFDSLGSKHTLRVEFRKTDVDTATGSTWSLLVTVPEPSTISTLYPTNELSGSIRFNNDGSLATFTPQTISFTGNNGSQANQQVSLSLGTANAFDGMTSFDSRSATSGISQDGFTGGDLVGIRIDQSGTLVGSFSNGRSFGLAQISMAKFTNNEGLSTEGGSVYVQTANSGDPIIGTAATAGRGFIQSAALEASNVDLSRALTQLIIIQRGFQANGKTITTSDQLLQTLIGLKN